PSGTRVAAIVTPFEDKHQLLVYDVKTQKIETFGGAGEQDIASPIWLNDTRLIFGLSTRKFGDIGLLAADVGSLKTAYPVQQYNASRLISVRLKDRLRPLVWNKLGLAVNRDEGVAAINTDITTGKLMDLTVFGVSSTDVSLTKEDNDKHIADTYP